MKPTRYQTISALFWTEATVVGATVLYKLTQAIKRQKAKKA